MIFRDIQKSCRGSYVSASMFEMAPMPLRWSVVVIADVFPINHDLLPPASFAPRDSGSLHTHNYR